MEKQWSTGKWSTPFPCLTEMYPFQRCTVTQLSKVLLRPVTVTQWWRVQQVWRTLSLSLAEASAKALPSCVAFRDPRVWLPGLTTWSICNWGHRKVTHTFLNLFWEALVPQNWASENNFSQRVFGTFPQSIEEKAGTQRSQATEADLRSSWSSWLGAELRPRISSSVHLPSFLIIGSGHCALCFAPSVSSIMIWSSWIDVGSFSWHSRVLWSPLRARLGGSDEHLLGRQIGWNRGGGRCDFDLTLFFNHSSWLSYTLNFHKGSFK